MLNEKNVPLPLQVWAIDNTYTGKNEGKVISATGLLRSVKQIILSRRVSESSSEDIIDSIEASIGTAIHEGIERAWVLNYEKNLKELGYSDETIAKHKINPIEVAPGDIPVYLEKRVEKQILDWTVTGQFDMVYNGQLIDFKSTGTYTYETKCKDKDYIMQGSIYRWLNSELITKDTIAINFIFKNWVEKEHDPNYPPARVLEYKLQLKSIAETTTFILDKLTRLNQYYDSEEKAIPDCTQEELMMKPSKWAYYANPASSRATRVLDTAAEAYKLVADKGKGMVEERKGQPVACRYCKGKALCSQYKNFVEKGLI